MQDKRITTEQKAGGNAGPETRQHAFPKLPYTQVPNVLFDDYMVDLSRPALLCLLYITRHTFGYKKPHGDTLSIEQFCTGIVTRDGRRIDRGTGLKRRTVYEALDELDRYGLIRRVGRERSDGGTLPSLFRLDVEGEDDTDTGSAFGEH